MSAPYVLDLGEDSDAWLVLHTTDPAVAQRAIEAHVRDVCGGFEDEVLAIARQATPIPRRDWWMQVLADGDSMLRYVSDDFEDSPALSQHAKPRLDEPLFEAVWVA